MTRDLRTFIVLHRLAENRVLAVYLNDVTQPSPYIATLQQSAIPPPVGTLVSDLPEVGETAVVITHAGVRSVAQRLILGLFVLLLAVPLWAQLPDPTRTPGATNLAITQATIAKTICNPNWSTKSIRPPASFTTVLKKRQMKAWHLKGTPAQYEEDHLIALELGGAPRDPKNLWPEPYAGAWGAKKKDRLENTLHRLVCDGTLTLADAQYAIQTDWVDAYTTYVGAK